jgi:hypothetical protein
MTQVDLYKLLLNEQRFSITMKGLFEKNLRLTLPGALDCCSVFE